MSDYNRNDNVLFDASGQNSGQENGGEWPEYYVNPAPYPTPGAGYEYQGETADAAAPGFGVQQAPGAPPYAPAPYPADPYNPAYYPPGYGYAQPPYQAPVYSEPQAPVYGEPQAPVYSELQAPVYGEPQAPVYGEPQAPVYGEPQAPVYGEPQAPVYGEPQAPQSYAPYPVENPAYSYPVPQGYQNYNGGGYPAYPETNYGTPQPYPPVYNPTADPYAPQQVYGGPQISQQLPPLPFPQQNQPYPPQLPPQQPSYQPAPAPGMPAQAQDAPQGPEADPASPVEFDQTAQTETVDDEFQRKFAEAFQESGSDTVPAESPALPGDSGLTGFDQLATALERKMQSSAGAAKTPWPPRRDVQPEPEVKKPVEVPKDVFAPSVTIDPPAKPKMQDTEIFRIAEELSQAVLVKSYSRAFNDNNLMKEGKNPCIEIESLSSQYYVSEGGGAPYRMFDNVSFALRGGSCCGLVSEIALTNYVLARAVCDNADAGNDECVRVADTPDGRAGTVFYIGSDRMLPMEMTVEEFLMYSISNSSEDTHDRLSVLLTQLGMSALQDMILQELRYNERILVLTLAAALNQNILCVVVNDPAFRIEAEDEMMARRIFALVSNRGKSCLLSCCTPQMISAVANRIAVIKKGRLVFFDNYKKFVDENCLGIMSFHVNNNASGFIAQIEKAHPGIAALAKDNLVYLIRRKGYPEVNLDVLLKDIISLGADYNSIVMDEKSFAVACKEVLS